MAAVERTDWREEPKGRKISYHYSSPGKERCEGLAIEPDHMELKDLMLWTRL